MTNPTRYAAIGTVSHGTLRTEDLIEAFSRELDYLANRSDMPRHPQIDNILKDAADCRDFDSEDASDIVQELIEWLQEYAPPFAYFGAHEGDGSDFGFWIDHDQIDEATH